jgi:hypothetical protein
VLRGQFECSDHAIASNIAGFKHVYQMLWWLLLPLITNFMLPTFYKTMTGEIYKTARVR